VGIKTPNAFSQQAKSFERFFEAQLKAIGLADEQLSKQGLSELRDSLETINDAIRNPDSFGSLNLRFDARAGFIISSIGGESHIQIGVLPLLLQKKRYVRERLRATEASEEVIALREDLQTESDAIVRRSLSEKITWLEKEVEKWTTKSEQIAKIDLAQSLEVEAKRASIAADLFERRSRVWQQFLARESIATIMGALLVLSITICLLLTGFFNYTLPEIIKNAYLVILGYFFGQGAKPALPRNSRHGDVDSTNSEV